MFDQLTKPGILSVGVASSLAFFSFSGCSKAPSPTQSAELTVPQQLTNQTSWPKDVTMTEDLASIGTDMTIKSGGRVLGTVQEKNLSLAKKFELADASGKIVASGRKQLVSFGVKIDLYDSSETKIGSIEEQVFRNPFSLRNQYFIKDAKGTVLASSEKLQFAATDISIRDPQGNEVVSVRRGAFNLLRDTWDVRRHSESFDFRYVAFIPAFKTSADNSK